MKHAFYFRFYKIFHSEPICNVLASMAYMLYCFLFLIKKLTRKKEIVTMTVDEAETLINTVYPRPYSSPEYINPVIRSDLDLSIVVPVYNYADIIEDTILAILSQKTSYQYEVILVDDGSTDGAGEILKKFESIPKVQIISQENGGIGTARNTGINHAAGKYLMFVDCDDIVHDDIVETLMSRAYKDNLDMVMAAHNLVKEKNGEIYSVIPNIYPQKNLVGYKNGDAIMNYPGLPWAKVYRRELWNGVRFFPGYWYEDTIIQFLIFTQVKSYAYIPKIVYEYKWYEKNFSHIQNNKMQLRSIERYWLLNEIIERYEQLKFPLDARFYTLLITHFSAYFYSFISGHTTDVVDALFILAKSEIDKYTVDKNRLPYVMKNVEKAFCIRDKALWRLASAYQ